MVRRWRSTSRAPPAFLGVVGELALKTEAFAQLRRVLGSGDELSACEVKVAFAQAFLGHPQAVAEFQLGLVEVGLEPVQGVLPELPGAYAVRHRPGDNLAGLEGLVVG